MQTQEEANQDMTNVFAKGLTPHNPRPYSEYSPLESHIKLAINKIDWSDHAEGHDTIVRTFGKMIFQSRFRAREVAQFLVNILPQEKIAADQNLLQDAVNSLLNVGPRTYRHEWQENQ